tara:strand:- start:4589 stop:5716 length:1128 start_codon:yes stop_codon:yes gene_type:complete
MGNGPTLILLYGNLGSGEAEAVLARTRLAAAKTNALAAQAGGFGNVILATDSDAVTADASFSIDYDGTRTTFSLWKRIKQLVTNLSGQGVAVMGAGALPLLTASDFAAVREEINKGGNVAVTNNFYSSDLTAWSPAERLEQLGAFDRDNVLPRMLRDKAGCEVTVLPRTVRTAFDLDTPAELSVLALSEATPRNVLDTLPLKGSLPLAQYQAFMPLLCNPNAEILVAGRVGSSTWKHLERETACRVRIVSEERGLSGAPEGHLPRSLIGRLLEELGLQRFTAELASLADGIVLDTRILLAQAGSKAVREDRFQSDLLTSEKIADPWLRDLTAALKSMGPPVLLGGHSLVNGGLMALSDQAWLENDRRLGRTPPLS